jgi:H+-transporting ATPase
MPQTPTDAKAEPKPEVQAESSSDLTPQITKRAYELYEKRGRRGDQAAQDWEQAKREVTKNAANPKLTPEDKNEIKPEEKAKAPTDLTPQLVKRVHELYEELGREDLRAVEELERTERETANNKANVQPTPAGKAEPQVRS